MRVIDRERHEHRRLVARVTEHQSLVAGTLVHVFLGGTIDSACDVRRLPAVADQYRTAFGFEAQLRIGVADAMDGVPRDARVVMLVAGRYLAGHHHEAGGHQRLCCYPRVRIQR